MAIVCQALLSHNIWYPEKDHPFWHCTHSEIKPACLKKNFYIYFSQIKRKKGLKEENEKYFT
jgi:hypothetical protein